MIGPVGNSPVSRGEETHDVSLAKNTTNTNQNDMHMHYGSWEYKPNGGSHI